MLTLIVEDGTGLSNSNAYATAEDGDAYHDGHLYADIWTNADTGTKEKALVMAARTMDNLMNFVGSRNSITQAMAWPRVLAEDSERADWTAWGFSYGFWNEDPTQSGIWGPYWATNVVPPGVRAASIEMARNLMATDRTLDDPSKGINSIGIGQGAIAISFKPDDRRKIFTDFVMGMLSPFGTYRLGGLQFPKTARG